MRNLSNDPTSAFSEYKKAVSRKSNGPDKTELEGIEKEISSCYNLYEQCFISNSIESITPDPIGAGHKAVLLDLYGSEKSIIKNFRNSFFQRNPQSYNNLCPYCTINEANTTEHILPKESFPEYAVDLLNLIPACSYCNSKKGEDVLDNNGEKITINYYLDILPTTQYLFVDIINNNGVLQPRYFLANPNNLIDNKLFDLLQRHYIKYDLIGGKSRFEIKAIQELSELINTYLIEQFSSEAEYDAFAQKQIRKSDLDAYSLGANHWKVVLVKGVANSNIFKQYIFGATHIP